MITDRGHSSQRVGQVVGDHQRRDVERAHDVGELAAGRRVEVRRRLVEHQDLGLHRQHGRDRDPAALPEAEVVGRPVGEVAPCRRRRAPRRPAASSSAPRSPRLAGPKADVVAHGRHEQLVVGVLEDDADPAADLAQVRLRRPGARRPAPSPAPAAEDAVEVQHERRLAGAVRAEEGDPLALVAR